MYVWKWSLIISLFGTKIHEFFDSTNTLFVGWMLSCSCILLFYDSCSFQMQFCKYRFFGSSRHTDRSAP